MRCLESRVSEQTAKTNSPEGRIIFTSCYYFSVGGTNSQVTSKENLSTLQKAAERVRRSIRCYYSAGGAHKSPSTSSHVTVRMQKVLVRLQQCIPACTAPPETVSSPSVIIYCQQSINRHTQAVTNRHTLIPRRLTQG